LKIPDYKRKLKATGQPKVAKKSRLLRSVQNSTLSGKMTFALDAFGAFQKIALYNSAIFWIDSGFWQLKKLEAPGFNQSN
jgi:hypothetical protein